MLRSGTMPSIFECDKCQVYTVPIQMQVKYRIIMWWRCNWTALTENNYWGPDWQKFKNRCIISTENSSPFHLQMIPDEVLVRACNHKNTSNLHHRNPNHPDQGNCYCTRESWKKENQRPRSLILYKNIQNKIYIYNDSKIWIMTLNNEWNTWIAYVWKAIALLGHMCTFHQATLVLESE